MTIEYTTAPIFSENDMGELLNISREFASFYHYSAEIECWHDKSFNSFDHPSWSGPLRELKEYLIENGISVRNYAILACTLAFSPTEWDTIGRLYCVNTKKCWIKELNKYCGNPDLITDLCNFLLRFFQLQIEHKGQAYTTKSLLSRSLIDPSTGTLTGSLFAELLHVLAGRIRVFKMDGIDPLYWLETKFERIKKAWDTHVALPTIIRHNTLDPDLSAIKAELTDAWSDIRKFLGVSPACQFPDGYIPKGFNFNLGDKRDSKDICKIQGNSHYYYPDGTQRRGSRHYQTNPYFVIKCTPDNFEEFKKTWREPLESKSPTWEEYSKYGVTPEWWDEEGKSTNGRGATVKWRKNANT